MDYAKPKFTKNQINKAEAILALPDNRDHQEYTWAITVLANWRACHAYPINTFQATLRTRLKSVDQDAIVAQRLKRTPSIISKLQRFEGMMLSRMQDIGGLRAALESVPKVNALSAKYRSQNLKHVLTGSKDYIKDPKDDGYRSIHLIYKYKNPRARSMRIFLSSCKYLPVYNMLGLLL